MERTLRPGVPRARVGSVGSRPAAAMAALALALALAALERGAPARGRAEQARADELVPFIRPEQRANRRGRGRGQPPRIGVMIRTGEVHPRQESPRDVGGLDVDNLGERLKKRLRELVLAAAAVPLESVARPARTRR